VREGYTAATNERPSSKSRQADSVEYERSVDFVLNARERDASLPKPYHDCGNDQFYTADNLRKREKLRGHGAVGQSIERFGRLFPCGANGMIEKGTYLAVHRELTRILRPELDKVAMTELADVDWQQDTAGTDRLHRDELSKILFDFVDTWTNGINSTEYMMFLDKLYCLLTPSRNGAGAPIDNSTA
jgi:hypothetical protein